MLKELDEELSEHENKVYFSGWVQIISSNKISQVGREKSAEHTSHLLNEFLLRQLGHGGWRT